MPNRKKMSPTRVVRNAFFAAAAEAAVGLGLVISIYRHARTTDIDEMNRMKG